ncbi:CIC11C00000001657 [Sungouiella intermedia]|uniref:Sensitive to high expression protein 9, mitochondrial n=1 Tax=Sungouiella intermedia TaxID=45354 RepID=A0A1L0BCJ8_9ASCO|nr:CIC11C00000001657 [[Candida] intermedia]
MLPRSVGRTLPLASLWPMAALSAKSTIFFLACRNYASFDDSKLRQIIETSNMGMAHQLEKQKREIDLAQKHTARWLKIERNYKHAQSTTAERLRAGALGSSLSGVTTHSVGETEVEGGDVVKKLRNKLSDLRATLTSATQALNDLTGYTRIETLKMAVDGLENELRQAKSNLKIAKAEYTEAIQRRSDLQKEINELLTRKHNWTPTDLERFTELYRNDHQNQQDERDAEIKLEETEVAVDTVQVKLTQLILTRYHEEQIWSDLGYMDAYGSKRHAFAVATFLVEPWKRRRLVDAFQHEVQLKLDEFSSDIRNLSKELEKSRVEPVVSSVDETLKISETPQLNSLLVSEQNSSAPAFCFGFSSIKSWSTFQTWAKRTFWSLRDPQTNRFIMDRLDFGIFLGLLVTFGGTMGALLTYLIVK